MTMTAMTMVLTLARRWQVRLRTAWRPLRVDLQPVPLGNRGESDGGRLSELMVMPGQSAVAIEAAVQGWAQWCAEHAGACVEVALSAHWLLVTVGEDAPAVWQHYYGVSEDELGQHWVRRQVDMGAGQALHCAMPRALLDGVQAAARAHAIKLVWMGPWWIRQLEQHVRAQRDLGECLQPWSACEPGLTVRASLAWEGHARQPVQVRQLWCEAEAA